MATAKVVSVQYRAVDANKKVVVVSDVLQEVLTACVGQKVSVQSRTQILHTGNWEELKKKEIKDAGSEGNAES
jgi:hypothetical protein